MVGRIAAGRPAIGLIPLITEWEDRKTPLLIAAEQPKSFQVETGTRVPLKHHFPPSFSEFRSAALQRLQAISSV